MSLPPLVEPADGLTVDEVRRYGRHLVLPDLGVLGQRRLKNARVLVVGAGGLGSPVLLYLAAAGVGTLGVVDPDVVEESNLQRQVVHGSRDVGRGKAESAREAVLAINPLVQVRVHEYRLDAATVMATFRGYDLVVDGTDNFATRYLVNDACVLLGLPYVWGSVAGLEGQVSVFWADPPAGPDGRRREGVHYRDLYPEPPPPGTVPSCAEGGVLGVTCAAIGSVMATEAVKLLTGVGEPLLGRLLVLDALGMTWREVRVRADPAGAPVTGLVDYEAFCGPGAAVPGQPVAAPGTTVSVHQLRDMLRARERGERDFVLVDVREPAEAAIVGIPGAVLVPRGELLSGAGLQRLPADRPLVLHCRTGTRSAAVVDLLRRAGRTDTVHVDGGVLAWVEQIEPDKPTY